MALQALMYRVPTLVSVAEDMTDVVICNMLSTAPLLVGGSSELLEQRKWPPAQLQVLPCLGMMHQSAQQGSCHLL